VTSDIRKNTRKMMNRIFAMPANATTRPVKPKTPAIRAKMRNVIINPNIVFDLPCGTNLVILVDDLALFQFINRIVTTSDCFKFNSVQRPRQGEPTAAPVEDSTVPLAAVCPENAEEARRARRKCGGTRFLQKAGFPRPPSGKNSYVAGGIADADARAHCNAPFSVSCQALTVA